MSSLVRPEQLLASRHENDANTVFDIYQSEGGPVYVGSTQQGEWLEYTVTVSRTADYVATISVSAAGQNPGAVAVHVDGEWFNRFDVSPTGTNSKFVQLTSASQTIEAGTE